MTKAKDMDSASTASTAQHQPPRKRRWWKVTWISLCSLLGLLVVAIALVVYLVLTPARLTSIVNRLADKYILCETNFDNVDLTVVKTFPHIGLKVDGVSIINPIENSKSDTVAYIESLVVGVNLREFIKNDNIVVTELHLDNTTANLYTNAKGESNFDIFPSSDNEDTTTSKFEIPDLISLKSIRINNFYASYTDDAANLSATLDNVNMAIDGKCEYLQLDADMKMDIDALLFSMGGESPMKCSLKDVSTTVALEESLKTPGGHLTLTVADGNVAIGGEEFVGNTLQSMDGNLLSMDSKFDVDILRHTLILDSAYAHLKEYALTMWGSAQMANEDNPTSVDIQFATNSWNVKRLLAVLPDEFTQWQSGMTLDGDITMTGHVHGPLASGELPTVTANLQLRNGRYYDKRILPYNFTSINGDISADLNFADSTISTVEITKLSACTGRNSFTLTGHIDDLLGAMETDARLHGNVVLSDLHPLLPDDMDLQMQGRAALNLSMHTNLHKLKTSDFAHMRLNGDIAFSDLDVVYDSIYAQVPQATFNIQLPSKMKRGLFDELLSATLTSGNLCADLPGMDIDGIASDTRLTAAISNIFKSDVPFQLVCDFDFATLEGRMDTIDANITNPKGSFAMIPQKDGGRVKYILDYTNSALHCTTGDNGTIDLAGLTIKGGADYDSTRNNTLQKWSPNLDVDFKRGYIEMAQLSYLLQIPDIKFNYKPERCEIASANVVFGNSDIYLSGAVTGLEKWLSHEEMLCGDLYLTSNYTNVDDLLDVFSGMGSDPDTLEQQREIDNVDTSAHPFIVPRDVDFTLHTRIKEATAFDNDLREVAGDVQVRDGIAVLNQVGFVCKAARMQLTGMYRTPRLNHIFVGMDFHLLDINIQELINMIPYVDTLVPLLSDLEGSADFHLCAETYVDAFYKPKMSTLRGAAALTGQDLVVLDNKDIDRIAKLLQMKKWREDDSKIHVDSLDVAMTVFRRELEVYPFLLSLHKYQIVTEGRHNLSGNYDYHVEIVESPLPVRLAVDVFGTMPQLKFDISPKLRYKNLYRPQRRSDVDEEVLRLKAMIRQSLEANVKSTTRDYQGLDGNGSQPQPDESNQ